MDDQHVAELADLYSCSDSVREYLDTMYDSVDATNSMDYTNAQQQELYHLARIIIGDLDIIGIKFTRTVNELLTDSITLRMIGLLNKYFNTDIFIESIIEPLSSDKLDELSVLIGRYESGSEFFIQELLTFCLDTNPTNEDMILLSANDDLLYNTSAFVDRVEKIRSFFVSKLCKQGLTAGDEHED
jgi:hypothetical protein